MNYQEVGARIKFLRGELSQAEFGRLVKDCSQTYVGMVETGKRKPSIEFLFSLASNFKVSIDYLLTGKEHSKTAIFEPEEKTKLLEENRILHNEIRALRDEGSILKKKFKASSGF